MKSRPNVLFILTDQHNRRIARFAGNKIVRTNNLDRLASEGVHFQNAYCQFPLCTPSRISMWTGRLPHKCGAMTNNMPIFPEFLTIPEHFANHGYITCGIGKMHVGGPDPMNGFQFRPYGDLKCNKFCGHQPDPIRTAKDQIWTRHDIGHFPFAGESEIPESLLQDSVVTKETIAFILEHIDKHPNQPWFVCASYSRPHHPLTSPGRYFRRYWPNGPDLEPLPPGFPDKIHPHDRFIVDDYRLTAFTDEERRRALAAYYASVDFVDDCIGELLSALEKNGALDNTIILYTSDHGDMMSEHGLWWKRTYYDGASQVPLLIKAPGLEPSTISEAVELLDIFPTLCDLAGVPIPDGLDGESLVNLIRGDLWQKGFIRCEHIARKETSFRMIRTREWKYVEFPEFPPVLFDMVNDPDETTNLANSKAYADKVAELNARLWEDGESWETLFSARQSFRERAETQRLTYDDATPNQYRLADGTIVDAEGMLYGNLIGKDL